MFGENITEKGNVQNIGTQCGCVRIKCGVTGSSDYVVVLVVVGKEGYAYRVVPP
jgi:hypothetical protein